MIRYIGSTCTVNKTKEAHQSRNVAKEKTCPVITLENDSQIPCKMKDTFEQNQKMT